MNMYVQFTLASISSLVVGLFACGKPLVLFPIFRRRVEDTLTFRAGCNAVLVGSALDVASIRRVEEMSGRAMIAGLRIFSA